jgi:hypothetical protein
MLQAAKTPCFVPNEVIGFIDLFLPPALWPWGRLWQNKDQESSFE